MRRRKASSARLCCWPLLRRSVVIDVGVGRAGEQESVGGTALLWMECSGVQCIAGMESGAVPRGITPFRREGGLRATKGEGGRVEGGPDADGAAAALSSVFIRQASVI